MDHPVDPENLAPPDNNIGVWSRLFKNAKAKHDKSLEKKKPSAEDIPDGLVSMNPPPILIQDEGIDSSNFSTNYSEEDGGSGQFPQYEHNENIPQVSNSTTSPSDEDDVSRATRSANNSSTTTTGTAIVQLADGTLVALPYTGTVYNNNNTNNSTAANHPQSQQEKFTSDSGSSLAELPTNIISIGDNQTNSTAGSSQEIKLLHVIPNGHERSALRKKERRYEGVSGGILRPADSENSSREVKFNKGDISRSEKQKSNKKHRQSGHNQQSKHYHSKMKGKPTRRHVSEESSEDALYVTISAPAGAQHTKSNKRTQSNTVKSKHHDQKKKNYLANRHLSDKDHRYDTMSVGAHLHVANSTMTGMQRSKTTTDASSIYQPVWKKPDEKKLISKTIQTPCYYDIYEDPNKIKRRIEELEREQLIDSSSSCGTSSQSPMPTDSNIEQSACSSDAHSTTSATNSPSPTGSIKKVNKKDEIKMKKQTKNNTPSESEISDLLKQKDQTIREAKIRHNEKLLNAKAKIQYLAEKVRDQMKQIEGKDKELSTHVGRIDNMKSRESELKGRLDEKNNKIDSLRDRLEKMKKEKKDREKDQSESASSDNVELNELTRKYENLLQESESAELQNDERIELASKQIQDLVEKVKTMQGSVDNMEMDNEGLKLKEKQLTQKVLELRAGLEDKNQALNELRNELVEQERRSALKNIPVMAADLSDMSERATSSRGGDGCSEPGEVAISLPSPVLSPVIVQSAFDFCV